MSTEPPPLTKAQGEKLNQLHHAHVVAVQKEATHRGMTCDLPRDSPEGRAAEDEAVKLAHQSHEARTAYYAHVRQLTGGETST